MTTSNVTSSVARDHTTTVELGMGGDDVVVTDKLEEGFENLPEEDEDNGDDHEQGADDDLGGFGDDDDDTGGDGDTSKLGDYSPERAEEFDAVYNDADGTLRADVLTAEWERNFNADAGTGQLNEATYAYLEDRGFPRDFVKQIEAGQAAIREQSQTAIINIAGGRENLQKMVEWGKTGGYSKAARDRFNRAIKSPDPEVRAEAVAALKVRFDAANGKGGKRRTGPLRSATRNSGEGAAPTQGFASRAAWVEARKNAKGNPREEAAVQKKYRASPVSRWKD